MLIRKDGPFEIWCDGVFGYSVVNADDGYHVFSGSRRDCEILLLWWQEWAHGWTPGSAGVLKECGCCFWGEPVDGFCNAEFVLDARRAGPYWGLML